MFILYNILGKYEVKYTQFASVVTLVSDKCKEQQNINYCRMLANEFNLSTKQLEATLLITFCQLQNWVHIDDMFVNKVILFFVFIHSNISHSYYLTHKFPNSNAGKVICWYIQNKFNS